VQVPIYVDKVIRKPGADRFTLLRQKAGGFFVLIWPRKVNRSVGGIKVSADDQSVTLCPKICAEGQKRIVEVQLELDSFLAPPAAGKVGIDQGKVGMLRNMNPAFTVESGFAKAAARRQWFCLAQSSYTTIALTLSRVPEGMVSLGVFHLLGELIVLDADLLEAENVRTVGGKPIPETFAHD
jgi:hypothetical protein